MSERWCDMGAFRCHEGSVRRWCGKSRHDWRQHRKCSVPDTTHFSRWVAFLLFVHVVVCPRWMKQLSVKLWCKESVVGMLPRNVGRRTTVPLAHCTQRLMPHAYQQRHMPDAYQWAPRSCSVPSYIHSVGRRNKASQWARPKHPRICNVIWRFGLRTASTAGARQSRHSITAVLRIINKFYHPVRVLNFLCFVSSLPSQRNVSDHALVCGFP